MTVVLEELAKAGVSSTDLWNGDVDLMKVSSAFQKLWDKRSNNHLKLTKASEDGNESHTVEFQLPDLPEFKGVVRKIYRVQRFQPVEKVLLLCEPHKRF